MIPAQIYFSNETIPAHFLNNVPIVKTIYDLKKRVIDSKNISPIRVVKYDDKYVSLDNRRLYAFQNAFPMQPVPIIVLDSSVKQLNVHRNAIIEVCECAKCTFYNAKVNFQKEKNKCKEIQKKIEEPDSLLTEPVNTKEPSLKTELVTSPTSISKCKSFQGPICQHKKCQQGNSNNDSICQLMQNHIHPSSHLSQLQLWMDYLPPPHGSDYLLSKMGINQREGKEISSFSFFSTTLF